MTLQQIEVSFTLMLLLTHSHKPEEPMDSNLLPFHL